MQGGCARCGAFEQLVDVRKVVSRKFTAYDGWVAPGGAGICHACTWAYRSPLLRSVAHEVRQSPELLTPLDRTRLGTVLSGPVPADMAVIVPLRPGRKHLISDAEWGCVTSEYGSVPWDEAAAQCVRTVHHLRRMGFSCSEIQQSALPWRKAATMTNTDLLEGMELWSSLDRWRQRPAWLEIALHTTPAEVAAA